MDKPLNLIIEDSKQAILKVINDTGLPVYLLEPILKDIYVQTLEIKKRELVKSKEEYDKKMQSKMENDVKDNTKNKTEVVKETKTEVEE